MMVKNLRLHLGALALVSYVKVSHGFVSSTRKSIPQMSCAVTKPSWSSSERSDSSPLQMITKPLQSLLNVLSSPPSISSERTCQARDLLLSLASINCFSSESGAVAFGEACAADIVFEDCFESQPILGKEAVANHMVNKALRKMGKGDLRIDMISDGDYACGFAWTWIAKDGKEEGLRGTTFVELNNQGRISYVREIAEPLYKPGNLTVELLKAITKDAQPRQPPVYQPKTPRTANEIAKYLFLDVQGGDVDEAMRFFSDDIVYRDFNYEEPLRSPADVKQFILDFSFPGIEFKPDRFDDGILSTCFTWEVCLEGQQTSIKGMSFYKLDPDSRLITYVRDIPEPAIKPPPLGALARFLRPGLGVFVGVPVGSRPGGM